MMKVTSAALFCFMTLLANSFSVLRAKVPVGRSARREHGKLSPILFQHSEFYAVSQDFNCHYNKLYLFKMLVCWHGGCISAQMVFTSSLDCNLRMKLCRQDFHISFLTLHCLAGHWIWKFTYWFFFKPKSEKPPTSLLYGLEEKHCSVATKNSLPQIVWFNPSLHDWR